MIKNCTKKRRACNAGPSCYRSISLPGAELAPFPLPHKPKHIPIIIAIITIAFTAAKVLPRFCVGNTQILLFLTQRGRFVLRH